MEQTETTILYIQTNEISLLDIPRVLDEMGYEVYQADFHIKGQEYDELICDKIIAAIYEFHIRYVISYDFIMTIAQACMEGGVPYLAWVYDAPQIELYTRHAMYPSNYVFAFDKMQVSRVREIGIKHAVHMPLAVHPEKVDLVTNTIGSKKGRGYQTEITFIGQLYNVEVVEKLLLQMDEKLRQKLYENIDACFLKWDITTHMHGLMSEECVSYFGQYEGHKVKAMYPYISEQFYYEAGVLSRLIAHRERVHILNLLAERYDLTFYTKDKDTSELSEKVRIKPPVDYDVLSHIYRRSKINLNITLHCIETGVPQRVLDVIAAGGFMLSNYQEELEEMFIPGEEIVLYHNEQELEELVAYYLAHDEEREEIARRGQEKVLREYNYRVELTKALRYVEEAEKGRTESYIALQRRELRKQADILLSQKTTESYLELRELLEKGQYHITIQRTRDLSILRDMINCRVQAQRFDGNDLLDDVGCLQQAVQKYQKLKHGLWRVEQNLSYEKCMDTVMQIREKGVSLFFVSWMIYVQMQDREGTFLKLAALMAESDRVGAVRLLSYGSLFLRENAALLLRQAEYLLDMQLWDQALKTLQRIEAPPGEIVKTIEMLSCALHGDDAKV